ncbi:MAG TPA: phenylacetate--CoA ligase [Chitinivibrionales bacterium]|nr:phenylacetate--CoA ligase [Chitinivibrionales bacterium]
MTDSQKFETMSRDDLAQLQIERLQTTLNRVYRNVAFYRHALDAKSIVIENIRSIKDIENLPFTTKEDLRNSYPYDMFALPLRDIVRIHASSGTTGKPIVVGYSKNDIMHWSDLVARQLSWAGITEHDVVQIAFSYSLFTGGLGFHFGAEKIGASVIPASTHGNMRDQVTIMKDFKTSALICAPSTALSLARTMESMDVGPDQMQLKRGIFGSEPWSENVRKEIEEIFKITAYDSYGMSEIMGPGVSGECEKRDGLHVSEDHFIVEVIDPATLQPVADGQEGELVFTTITKEAFPVIRYRTGDRASLMPGPCACGRTFARMTRVKGRTDDMIVLRGAKLFPAQVFETVLGVEGIVPQCKIVLDRKDDADVMEICVAVASGSDYLDEIKALEHLRKTIAQRIKTVLGVTANVSFMEESSLQAESRGKKQPVVEDKRKL